MPGEEIPMSEQRNPNQIQDAETVTPLGVVKVVVALVIGVGALLAVLGVFGIFAWLSLWNLLFKLAAAAAILIAATFLIGWLMQIKK
jgi:hypothetical protein